MLNCSIFFNQLAVAICLNVLLISSVYFPFTLQILGILCVVEIFVTRGKRGASVQCDFVCVIINRR